MKFLIRKKAEMGIPMREVIMTAPSRKELDLDKGWKIVGEEDE